MKYSFELIKQLHAEEQGRKSPLGNLDLAGFAQHMQQADQDNDWSAGLSPDNFMGSMSRGIDSAIEATGATALGESIGGGIGSLVDSAAGRADQHYTKLGEQIGQGLPRQAADLGLTAGGFAVMAGTGGLATPVGASMIALGTADAGLSGWEKSGGSVGQGIAAGAMNLIAPGVGSAGGKLGLKMLPKALQFSAPARVAADQIGQQAAFTALQAAEMGVQGENPFTADNAFANALGLVAFAPLAVHGGIKVAQTTPKRVQMDARGNVNLAFTGKHSLNFDQAPSDVFDPLGESSINLSARRGPLAVEIAPSGKGPLFDRLTATREAGSVNIPRLTDYLLGAPDPDLATMLHGSSLGQVLESTGLDPSSMDLSEQMGMLGKVRGLKERIQTVGEDVEGTPVPKEQTRVEFFKTEEEALKALQGFPEGSTVMKTGGDTTPTRTPGGKKVTGQETSGEQWRVMAPRQNQGADAQVVQLANEAGQLLNAPTETLVDIMKLLQANNRFASRVSAEAESARLAQVGEGKQTQKGKIKPRAVETPEREKFGVQDPIPPDSPHERARWEAERERGKWEDPEIGPWEQAKPGFTNPAKGKVRAVEGDPNAAPKVDPSVQNPARGPQVRALGGSVVTASKPISQSEVFRFVKTNVGHDGTRFTQLGKTSIGGNGLIHQNRFLSETQMPKQVFELVKQVYPEAMEGENVNVNKLAELEQTRPLLETHVYGQDGAPNPAKAARDQMMHEWYDNQSQGAKSLIDTYVTEGGSSTASDPALLEATLKANGVDKAKLDQWMLLSQQARQDSVGPKATSYYNSISPFDPQKYPVVRIDVVVPTKKLKNFPESTNANSIKWQQDDLHENLPNTLGWAMVQFVPHPKTGETVMFVAEQQSRWGQTVAQNRKRANSKENGPMRREAMNADVDKMSHPLLDLQHKLVLKAAMDEARKRGVRKMVVSDGETAMMTEGHDTVENLPRQAVAIPVRRFLNVMQSDPDYSVNVKDQQLSVTSDGLTIAKFEVKNDTVSIGGSERLPRALEALFPEIVASKAEPSQAGGMRQHYDAVLPRAAEKMLRQKGYSVDFGVHKNAVEKTDMRVEDSSSLIKGSPVFRNPDGTPKTNATGKMFDIPEDMSGVRYSRGAGKPTEVYNTKTLRQQLDALAVQEGSMEKAQQRLLLAARAKLQRHVESVLGRSGDQDLDHARALMSITYDNMGLDPSMKPVFMGSVDRIYKLLEGGGTDYFPLIDFLKAHPGSGGDPETLLGLQSDPYVGVHNRPFVSVRTDMPTFGNSAVDAHRLLGVFAHESMHNLVQMARQHAETFGVDSFRMTKVREAFDFANKLDARERYQVMIDMYKNMLPKELYNRAVKESSESLAKYASMSPEEFMTEFGANFVLAKTSAGQKKTALRFLTEPLQNFIKLVYRGVDELQSIMGMSAREGNYDTKEFRKFMKDVQELWTPDPVIEAYKKQLTRSVSNQLAIEQGDIGGLTVRAMQIPSAAANAHAQQLTQLKEGNTFTRSVAQHQQMSFSSYWRENLPQYSGVVSKLTRMDGLAVTMQHGMLRDFFIPLAGGELKLLATLPDSKLTAAQRQQKGMIARVQDNPKVVEAVNAAFLKSNDLTAEAGKSGTAYPTFDHPEIQATLAHLTPAQIADVRHVFESYQNGTRKAADTMILVEHKKVSHIGARYLFSAGVDHAQAPQIAEQLFINWQKNGVEWAVVPDPKAGVEGVLANVPPGFESNPGAVAFAKHWQRIEPKFTQFVQNLDRPYFTEFRSGNFGVRYEVSAPAGGWNGDPSDMAPRSGYRSTNDKTAWDAIVKDVASDPRNSLITKIDHRNDVKNRFGQMRTQGIDEAMQLVRAHWEAAKESMDPNILKAIDESGFDPALPLAQKVASDLGVMGPRSFAPGREKINMLEAQNAYFSLIARKSANSITRMETDWLMQHSNWDKAPRLKQEMQDFRDGVLNAGRQQFQGFRKLTTAVVMGGNVASGITDSMQPITMGLWRATAEVGFVKALELTAKSFTKAFGALDKIADKEFASILTTAINQGFLKTGGSLENFMTSDDVVNYNVVRAADHRDMVDIRSAMNDPQFLMHRVFEQFSALGNKAFEVGMTPMRLSAQINNRSALYVGYELGKLRNLKGSALTDYAIQYMQVVNLQGQRAAHSSFKLKAGQANGLVEIGTLMTNYPIAVFSEMASNWRSMLKSSGLDSATRQKSMQAFAGQVITQMALAGIGGLGLGSLFEFAKDMFGLDTEKAIREGLAHIDESGTLGEVLLNGVANQLTGMDMASRFDLGGLGGFNPYTGFDAKGLFGAGGGTISALYNAPEQFASGDISKIQLIPTGIRRALTAYSDEAYKDMSGQVLIEPTAQDHFAMMLGYKPARMAQVLNQKNQMKSIEQAASKDSGQRKSEYLRLLQEGKGQEVQQKLYEEVFNELKDPQYSQLNTFQQRKLREKLVREKMLEIVNYGVEKALPFDPLQDGSGEVAAEKASAAASFGNNQVPRQSEVERLRLKHQMLGQMGVPTPRNLPKAVRHARMIDALIQQDPTLTRTQAAAIISRQ